MCRSCLAGSYSAEGAESCIACPAGYSCTDPSVSPTACDSGSYALGGAVTCTICPAGTGCATTSNVPTVCSLDSFAIEGSVGCTVCPAGYRCPNTTVTPTLCDVENGYYSPVGETLCLQCPRGSQCLFDSSAQNYTITECWSGQYRTDGDQTCEDCPAGYYCSSITRSPVGCPPGHYSYAGQVTCQACPAGKACYNGTNPTSCPAGWYSETLDEECYIVPQGWWSPNAWTVPEPCLVGTYSFDKSLNCTDCPPGWECPDTTGFATARECEVGTYSAGRQTSCTTCPAGLYCPYVDEAAEIPCDLGFYSYRGQQNCTACQRGFACPRANRESFEPQRCIPGTYSSGGQAECTVCPAGYECPDTMSDTVTECAAGHFTQPGETSCNQCEAGYYCPLTAVSSSQPLIGGYGIGKQIPCEAGSFSGSGSTTCSRCPLGMICPTPASADGGQVACPTGSYPALGTDFVTIGAVSCVTCPAGQICPTPFSSPSSCQPGTYSLTSGDTCTTCPAGSMCPSTTASPTVCPAGMYSYTGMTQCMPCSAGYLCPSGGVTPTPSGHECPVGSYCPSGSIVAILCPAGTYGNMTNGESVDQACHDCPAGYFCSEGTVGISETNKCPEGFYCPEASRQATPCPSGTYSSARGAVTRTVCLLCPAGFYCPAGTPGYGSRDCPPGFYCPEGTGGEYENPCPPGTFNEFSRVISINQCTQCLAGHECPNSGSVAATSCLPGYYQPLSGSTRCRLCEAGWACTATGQTESQITTCSAGHYCPTGTSVATANACPAGSYSFRTDLKRVEDCEICWRGYACVAGTGTSPNLEPQACALGHYCPGVPTPGNGVQYYVGSFTGQRTGSPTEYPCSAGSYSNSTSLWSDSQCSDCPRGMYCLGGQAEPTALCGLGHYCPIKSSVSTQVPCPAGTYNDQEGIGLESQCSVCRPGSFCPSGSSSLTSCPGGSYTSVNGTEAAGPTKDYTLLQCFICPAGYECSEGSSTPNSCGIGRYSAEGWSECAICEPGYYCPLETTTKDHKERLFECPSGLFCSNGTNHVPQADHHSCPEGHYCPTGTAAPVPCPVGFYNPLIGRSSVTECKPCDAGYYCAFEGMSNMTGECSPGYYCPLGSTGSKQVACPSRYYRLQPRAESEEFCAVCPRGSYCPEGTSSPVPCQRGYYCVAGAHRPEPCPIGTFGNSTDLRSQEECTPCTAGYYCDGMGLTHPTGLCDPGYYCISRAFTSAPPGLPTGGLCPKGGYCPVGSSYPTACAEGTFNNFTGGSSQQDCIDCTPGYYCSGSNLPYPTGPCSAGYYCTGKAKLPTQFRTPAGHYTGPGASAPVECPLGTFNPSVGQGECQPCLVGNYCPERAMVTYSACPTGSFCPAGTIVPESCPAGTYQPETRRQNITDCLPCQSGHYCEYVNASSPTGMCSAGYYCVAGCVTATCSQYVIPGTTEILENPPSGFSSGVLNSIGGECTYGSYCLNGTSTPYACPAGTYRDQTLGTDKQTDCQPCAGGYYCDQTGMSSLHSTASQKPQVCHAGYYCPGQITGTTCSGFSNCGCIDGQCSNALGESSGIYYTTITTVLQSDGARICPRGHKCPAGSSSPTQCVKESDSSGQWYLDLIGLYQNNAGKDFCIICPETKWCDDSYSDSTIALRSTYDPQDCPAGRYCPEGSHGDQPRCLPGTYSYMLSSGNVTECLLCPAGRYCPDYGHNDLSEYTPYCHAGYYCNAGALSGRGDLGELGGDGGPCPAGYFCPNGTELNTSNPCPAGTYNPSKYGTDSSACLACSPGMYCETESLTEPTGPCSPGYYCPSSCSDQYCSNAPCTGTLTGGPCPAGSFCPQQSEHVLGAATPTACLEGMYAPDIASPVCLPCPAGFYCGSGVSSPPDCTTGHYCPNGTTTSLPNCPVGTYRDSIGAMLIEDCVLCPPGQYCGAEGLIAVPSDKFCQTGYYCTSGAVDTFGNLGVRGGSGGVCPVGHYCGQGTAANNSFPCPLGTFNPYTQQGNESSCLPCTAGFYCEGEGLEWPSGPCKDGYYCPTECSDNVCSNKPCRSNCAHPSPYETPPYAEGGICPKAYFCVSDYALNPITNVLELRGAPAPTACPPGMYAPGEGLSECLECPAGYWCNFALSAESGYLPMDCPSGYYCPDNTTSPFKYPCPSGSYGSSINLKTVTDCALCPAGQYCPEPGLNQSTAQCFPGYWCSLGASTGEGEVGQLGGYTGPCPQGYYCPEGTKGELDNPCPSGTYQPFNNTGNSSACLLCEPGYYCTGEAQPEITSICRSGYYCPLGCSDERCQNLPCASGNCDNMIGGACPKGHYCPTQTATNNIETQLIGFTTSIGTVTPIPCPDGTYSESTGYSQCLDCPPGYYCPTGTFEPNLCPEGRYCPTMTGVDMPLCPSGSYSIQRGLTNVTECTLCDPGYYCADPGQNFTTAKCFPGWYCGMGAANAMGSLGELGGDAGECPEGFYCLEGTGSKHTYPCSEGTFQPSYGTTNESACLPCSGGYYCQGEGNSMPTSYCDPGYYCPVGCTDSVCSKNPCDGFCSFMSGGACPQGYFCPTLNLATDLGRPALSVTTKNDGPTSNIATVTPTQCPAGTYSSTGASACTECPAGYYCIVGTHTPDACPQGKYCPRGTGLESSIPDCPAGSFNNGTLLMQKADCTRCISGYACTSPGLPFPDLDCNPGYFCQSGAADGNGTSGELGGVGGACTPGSYCPVNTGFPIRCPPGTYSGLSTRSSLIDCITCPPGKYCITSELTEPSGDCSAGWYCEPGNIESKPFNGKCPEGMYCPTGSAQPTPCPAGYYNPAMLGMSEDDCIGCNPGSYCYAGSENATGLCAEGWFCDGNSTTPTPTGASEGSFCTAGHYCPEGSPSMTDCTPGYFCDTSKLAVPSGECGAGWYCILNAVTAFPEDGVTGNRCPTGHFCNNASGTPTPCPLGTYNPNEYGKDFDDCHICTPGNFCPSTGLSQVYGPCDAGYYCPGRLATGSQVSNPAEYICPAGHHCPKGSHVPIPCESGTFNTQEGQFNCSMCPAGYYCDADNFCPGSNFTTPELCPPGYYCPEGTRYSFQFPCPNTTYSNASGLEAADQCTPCDGGMFCASEGLTQPTAHCDAGYYCDRYSDRPAPTGAAGEPFQPDGSAVGGICPLGHYCPRGSATPADCPISTFMNTTGASSQSECMPCNPGYYCDTTGLEAPFLECNAGYYCPLGQHVPNPSDYICPYGHYCPKGSASWRQCPSGSVSLAEGESSCRPCPVGYYCHAQEPCNSTNYVVPRDCHEGYFCPEGTAEPESNPCLAGTYGTVTLAQTADACTSCLAGKFCDGRPGMTSISILESTFDCTQGYYCSGGATIAAPIDGSTGNNCPTGHYCPAGSSAPQECPIGSMLGASGAIALTDCELCTAGQACTTAGLTEPNADCAPGFYCPAGSTLRNPTATPCTLGFACPGNNSQPIVCDLGKYQDQVGMAYCFDCPPGYYCIPDETTVWPTAYVIPKMCDKGYYCPQNSSSPNEFACPSGTYQPFHNASSLDDCVPCDLGYACTIQGLATVNEECDSGFLCISGNNRIDPRGDHDQIGTGDLCPVGHYCTVKAKSATPCPQGYFGSRKGLRSEAECTNCTAGSYCSGGLQEPDGLCSAGYYCPGNNTESQPVGLECSGGKYCPEGSIAPLQCPDGTHLESSSVAAVECMSCPPGFVCNLEEQQGAPWYKPNDYVVPVYCPMGYYCPEGTSHMHDHPCPQGFYSNFTSLTEVLECISCTPGHYCLNKASLQETGVCREGYYCLQGSNTSTPERAIQGSAVGDICQPGRYCEFGTGTDMGTPCSAGRYSEEVGAINDLTCRTCERGRYCSTQGVATRLGTGPCRAGYYCGYGEVRSDPTDKQCPYGHYCPEGSSNPIPCDDGYYNDEMLKASCKICPMFFFCNSAAEAYQICPPNHYCPEGSAYPNLCPDGTYAPETSGERVALGKLEECVICPAGHYCNNGTITGKCKAGYLCEYGNYVPNPTDIEVTNSTSGFICPIGFYCSSGTEQKIPCHNGTVGLEVGLGHAEECTLCPSGSYCPEEVIEALPCPVGYYCTLGEEMRPCPRGTYNTRTEAEDVSWCKACRAGFTCPLEGTVSYESFPVPSGFYSDSGQEGPFPCPAGTFQPLGGGLAINSTSCRDCAAGHWCGPESVAVEHICPEGTYCPPRSAAPVHCPSGHYCVYGQNIEEPRVCPEGYYCPALTSTPYPCLNGTYCPGANSVPFLCPLGYESKNDTQIRGELIESCSICPAGQFSVNTLWCDPCDAGYICLEGATSPRPENQTRDGGYPCPVAHYCPAGAITEIPCPAGTYFSGTHAKSLMACLPCPSDSFSNQVGQDKCQDCGASSSSAEGATICDCFGANRVFQPSDKSCICKPNYIYYNENFRLSDSDSTIPCQERILSRCAPGTIRGSSGACITDTAQACKACPGQKGTVNANVGVCTCDVITFPNDVCNDACQATQSTIEIQGSNIVYTKDGVTTVIPLTASGLFGGSNSGCKSTSTCGMKFLRSTPGGSEGVYDPPQDLIESILGNIDSFINGTNATTASQGFNSRRLLQTTTADGLKAVPNPAVCLNNGEGLLFDVSEGYPRYYKDSLLNTNPNFDSGPFRELSSQLSGRNPPTSFMYTFNEAGVYVFEQCTMAPLNCDSNILTIVRVVNPYEKCPSASQFQPVTDTVLVSLGVTRTSNIILAPDWVLIGVLLVGLFILVLGIIAGLWHFRVQTWGMVGAAVPKYRTLGMSQLDSGGFAAVASKGSTTKRMKLKADGEAVVEDDGSSDIENNMSAADACIRNYILPPTLVERIQLAVTSLGGNSQAPPISGKWDSHMAVLTSPEESGDDIEQRQKELLKEFEIIYNGKPGNVLDELMENLSFPVSENTAEARRYILLVIADALQTRTDYSRPGIELLVLSLMTQEAADIDRFLGYEYAPPSYNPDSEQLWNAYTPNNDCISQQIASSLEQHLMGDSSLLKKWCKTLGCILTMSESIVEQPVYIAVTNVPSTTADSIIAAKTLGLPGPLFGSNTQSRVVSMKDDEPSVGLSIMGTTSGIPVTGVSQYPSEGEVLLPPFSKYVIDDTETGEKCIKLEITSQIATLTDSSFGNKLRDDTAAVSVALKSTLKELSTPKKDASRAVVLTLDIDFRSFLAGQFIKDVGDCLSISHSCVNILSITEGSAVVQLNIINRPDADDLAQELFDKLQDPTDSFYNKVSANHGPILDTELLQSPIDGQMQPGQASGVNLELMEDEFWDYERQIDLEGFNVRTLYDKLEDQTIHIVSQLANQADQYVMLYDKIYGETEALKDMFSKVAADLDERSNKNTNTGISDDLKTQLVDILKNLNVIEEDSDDERPKATQPIDTQAPIAMKEVETESDASDVDDIAPLNILNDEEKSPLSTEENPDAIVPTQLRDDADKPAEQRLKLMVQRLEWAQKLKVIEQEKSVLTENMQDDPKLTDEERLERLLVREQWRRNGQCPFSMLDNKKLSDPERVERLLLCEKWRCDHNLQDSSKMPATLTDDMKASIETRTEGLLAREEWSRQNGLIPDDTAISCNPTLYDDPSASVSERRKRADAREQRRRQLRLHQLDTDEIPVDLIANPLEVSDDKYLTVALKREDWRRGKCLSISSEDYEDTSLPLEERSKRLLRRHQWSRSNAYTPAVMTDIPSEPVSERLRKGLQREEQWHLLVCSPESEEQQEPVDDGSIPMPENVAKDVELKEAWELAQNKANLSEMPTDIDESFPENSALQEARRAAFKRGAKAATEMFDMPSELEEDDVQAEAFKQGVNSDVVPSAYQDDPNLSDEERADRAVKRAAFKTGMKIVEASQMPLELEEDESLSAKENKTRGELREVWKRAVTKSTQNAQIEAIPPELVDDPSLSKDERDHRTKLRGAFVKGREARHATELPLELEEEEESVRDAYEKGKTATELAAMPEGILAPEDAELLNSKTPKNLEAQYFKRALQAAEQGGEVPEFPDEEEEALNDFDKARLGALKMAWKRGSTAATILNPAPESATKEELLRREKIKNAFMEGFRSAEGAVVPEDLAKDPELADAFTNGQKSKQFAEEHELQTQADRKKKASLQAAFVAGKTSTAAVGDVPAELGESTEASQAFIAGQQNRDINLPPTDSEEARILKSKQLAAFQRGRAASSSDSIPTELQEDSSLLACYQAGVQATEIDIPDSELESKHQLSKQAAFKAGLTASVQSGGTSSAIPDELLDDSSLSTEDRNARADLRSAYEEGFATADVQKQEPELAKAFKFGRTAAINNSASAAMDIPPELAEELDVNNIPKERKNEILRWFRRGVISKQNSEDNKTAELERAFVTGRDKLPTAEDVPEEFSKDSQLSDAFRKGQLASQFSKDPQSLAEATDEEKSRLATKRAAFMRGCKAAANDGFPQELEEDADEEVREAFALGKEARQLVVDPSTLESESEKLLKENISTAFKNGRDGSVQVGEFPPELKDDPSLSKHEQWLRSSLRDAYLAGQQARDLLVEDDKADAAEQMKLKAKQAAFKHGRDHSGPPLDLSELEPDVQDAYTQGIAAREMTVAEDRLSNEEAIQKEKQRAAFIAGRDSSTTTGDLPPELKDASSDIQKSYIEGQKARAQLAELPADFKDSDDLSDEIREQRRKMRVAFKQGRTAARSEQSQFEELMEEPSAPPSQQVDKKELKDQFAKGHRVADAVVELENEDMELCIENNEVRVKGPKLALKAKSAVAANSLLVGLEDNDDNITMSCKDIIQEGISARKNLPDFDDSDDPASAKKHAQFKAAFTQGRFHRDEASDIPPELEDEEDLTAAERLRRQTLRDAFQAGVQRAKKTATLEQSIELLLKDDPSLPPDERERRALLRKTFMESLQAHESSKAPPDGANLNRHATLHHTANIIRTQQARGKTTELTVPKEMEDDPSLPAAERVRRMELRETWMREARPEQAEPLSPAKPKSDTKKVVVVAANETEPTHGEDVVAIAEDSDGAKKLKDMKQQHRGRMKELKSIQEGERQTEDETLESEAQEELHRIDENMDDDLRTAQDKLSKDLQAELAAAKTEGERDQIKEKFAAEANRMKDQIDQVREGKKHIVRKTLDARKQRKQKILEIKHKDEQRLEKTIQIDEREEMELIVADYEKRKLEGALTQEEEMEKQRKILHEKLKQRDFRRKKKQQKERELLEREKQQTADAEEQLASQQQKEVEELEAQKTRERYAQQLRDEAEARGRQLSDADRAAIEESMKEQLASLESAQKERAIAEESQNKQQIAQRLREKELALASKQQAAKMVDIASQKKEIDQIITQQKHEMEKIEALRKSEFAGEKERLQQKLKEKAARKKQRNDEMRIATKKIESDLQEEAQLEEEKLLKQEVERRLKKEESKSSKPMSEEERDRIYQNYMSDTKKYVFIIVKFSLISHMAVWKKKIKKKKNSQMAEASEEMRKQRETVRKKLEEKRRKRAEELKRKQQQELKEDLAKSEKEINALLRQQEPTDAVLAPKV